jgi:hypothetical protein
LFCRWARELAEVAYRAFTYTPAPGGPPRMYWKLSIDLSRPLVASMGQHDPLDGLVTCAQLDAAPAAGGPSLAAARAEFAAMVRTAGLATADPLGLGGLLVDAYRCARLDGAGVASLGLTEALLAAAAAGLRHYVEQPDLRRPASHRLAFRELGLAIGLAALGRDDWRPSAPVRARLDRLASYAPLRSAIEEFWLVPDHRRVASWLEHANINDVMLATTLEPDGFLG